MSNRLYDIINTFNKLVAKDEPKKQLTESAVAKPKSKLEETMAKVEADLKTFKESKKAKPDFLDVDKDGNKKEPFKKAIKDTKVNEMDYGGGRSPHGGHNLPRDAEDQPGPQVTVNPQKAKDAKKDIEDQLTKAFQNQPVKQNVGGKKVSEAAKPDFLDVDKDGNKKEPMKKAIKDKKTDPKKAFQGMFGGNAKELTKNLTIKKKTNEDYVEFGAVYAEQLAQKMFDMNPNFSIKGKADELLDAAWQVAVKDLGKKRAQWEFNYDEDFVSDFVSAYSWLQQGGRSKTNEDDDYEEYRKRKMADRMARGISPDEASKFDRNTMTKKGTWSKKVDRYDPETGKLVKQNVGRTKQDLSRYGYKFNEAAENPAQQRILDANKADLEEFLKTGYLDTTSDLYYQMYEYYANQMDPKVRRNQDAQYDFITAKIREVAGVNEGFNRNAALYSRARHAAEAKQYLELSKDPSKSPEQQAAYRRRYEKIVANYNLSPGELKEQGVNESAAPGQEAWIKKNKERFVKQYGKKKGMEVLYATAWKRSKNEGVHDAEVSEEDPVFEREDDDASYWDFKDLKDKPTSGTRKVSGTRYGGSAQKDDDDQDDEFSSSKKADAPKRGRGRPKGSGKKLGYQGPTGKSKLMSKGAIKESRPSLMDRLLDETYAMFGEDNTDLTLDQDQLRQHIGDSNFEQLRRAIQVTGTYPEDMYDMLYDYFSETGEMPYGAATAEDEDPYQWIHQKLDQMFGDEVGYDQENVDIDMGEPGEDEMNAESVNESRDMIAESLSRILHSYPYEVKTFLAGGDMDKDLYSALFDYYNDQGELPYQVKSGNDTVEWIADKFGTDLRNVELEEDGPKMSDVPAYLRKAKGENFPLSRDQVTPAEQHLWVVPGPGSRDFEARAFPNTPQGKMAADEFAYGVKGKVVVSAENPVEEGTLGAIAGGVAGAALTRTPSGAAVGAQLGDKLTDDLEVELNELARLAGLKESCGEMSPFTQTGEPEQQSGMSINTNIDTRTGTKTMTVTADGDVADKLAEILSLSGLAAQVTSRSSEVVGQEVAQEPEMQVVAVGEAKDEDAREKFHASTTPDPKVAGVEAIVDQGDDLHRKKKQHADKPKLGDNPMATEGFSLSKSLMRELESIKIKK